MFTELELSGIADFLTNSNDLMSWEDQATYLTSEYGVKSSKAKELVESYQKEFSLSPILLEENSMKFIKSILI